MRLLAYILYPAGLAAAHLHVAPAYTDHLSQPPRELQPGPPARGDPVHGLRLPELSSGRLQGTQAPRSLLSPRQRAADQAGSPLHVSSVRLKGRMSVPLSMVSTLD